MHSNRAEVGSPAVNCFAECPHFERVTGSCTHELNQALVRQFLDGPGAYCPVYTEWRAEEMAALARWLGSR